jgi:hypothetical protein
MCQYKRVLLILPVLSLIFFNQPRQAYAWFFGIDLGNHHDRHGEYSEVVVGGDRYYYNDGIYYRGAPGNYAVVQAPVGAVIYTTPPDFEQVNIDGGIYFRSHDVYYRPEGHGYRVVERPHEHRDDHHRQ